MLKELRTASPNSPWAYMKDWFIIRRITESEISEALFFHGGGREVNL